MLVNTYGEQCSPQGWQPTLLEIVANVPSLGVYDEEERVVEVLQYPQKIQGMNSNLDRVQL